MEIDLMISSLDFQKKDNYNKKTKGPLYLFIIDLD
jgi:hypothetical protein